MGCILLKIVITATGIAISVMIAGAIVIMSITEFLKTLLSMPVRTPAH